MRVFAPMKLPITCRNRASSGRPSIRNCDNVSAASKATYCSEVTSQPLPPHWLFQCAPMRHLRYDDTRITLTEPCAEKAAERVQEKRLIFVELDNVLRLSDVPPIHRRGTLWHDGMNHTPLPP